MLVVSVSWNTFERLLRCGAFRLSLPLGQIHLFCQNHFPLCMDKVACTKFLWQYNWVFLTLWSALSSIILFTFYLNFTPTVIAFWLGTVFLILVATSLNFGKGQMLCHGWWGDNTAHGVLSGSEVSTGYAVTSHRQTLKMDVLVIDYHTHWLLCSDLRPKAVKFVLYTTGSQVMLWKLKFLQTWSVRWNLPLH